MIRREDLQSLLAAKFDIEEIKKICYLLGISFNDLAGETKASKVAQLVLRAESAKFTDRLIVLLVQQRPEIAAQLRMARNTVEKHYAQDEIERMLEEQPAPLKSAAISRRRFFSMLAALVGAAGAKEKGDEVGKEAKRTRAYEPFVREVEHDRDENPLPISVVALPQVVLGNYFDFSLSAGTVHLINNYNIRHTQFSTNTLGAIAVCSALTKAPGNAWLQQLDEVLALPGIETDSDIIAIGSPISDPVSKLVMDYEGDGYRLLRSTDPILHLPFEYVMHEDQVDFATAPATRFVAGVERSMPNWRITEDGKFLPPPKLSKKGWIQTDYLLITRIPNVLSRKAFLSGSEILVVGGTHGTGTYAIRNLLEEPRSLAYIARETVDKAYYQILVPVTAISHELTQTESGVVLLSRAMSLGVPQIREVVVDDEKVLGRL